MMIKSFTDASEFTAGDRSLLRELFHPDKAGLEIGYSLARAVVKPGEKTLPHRLAGSEVYYILDGSGRMHVGPEQADVAAGQAVYIPPGAVQFIENTGPNDLSFLCIVDPAWRAEDEDVLSD